MNDVIIIGNSGAARECYWLLDDMLRLAPGFKNICRFGGFLSWKGYDGDLKELACHALGSSDNHEVRDNAQYVIGVGQPALRKAIFEEFKARGARFMTLVHPWADISPSAVIGEANIFQRWSSVFCNAVVGNANYCNGAVNLAHDVVVGDYNFLGPVVLLLGNCAIGSENQIGAQCNILPGARIGDGNIIAPGSSVYKGSGDNCRLAGNPARNLGKVADE